MKKIMFILLCLICIVGRMSAQAGETSIGVNLGYGSAKGLKSFKLGGELNWNATNAIRLAPSFDYFFNSSSRTFWDVSLDGHYLIPLGGPVKFFPLIGITLVHAGDNYVGANVGAGFSYTCTEHIELNLKGKYQLVKEADQVNLGIGLAYKF